MPQKSNPITSELILAAARTNGVLYCRPCTQAQIQEHGAGHHGWQVEWLTLPQMMRLTAAPHHARYLAKNLQVDQEKMRENIARADVLFSLKPQCFVLAQTMPRSKADELVKKACGIAVSEGKPPDRSREKFGRQHDRRRRVDLAGFGSA